MWELRENNRLEIRNLTSLPFEYNDDVTNKKLVELWGNSLQKLTPKQRQLVGEILINKKNVADLLYR